MEYTTFSSTSSSFKPPTRQEAQLEINIYAKILAESKWYEFEKIKMCKSKIKFFFNYLK